MSEYHHYWYTRFGTVGVDRFEKNYGYSRGRCRQHVLRIPLTRRWTLELSSKGVDYLALVNGPKYLRNLSWILDEFDASFNDLAVASLRYHMDHAVTYCDDERRAKYQDLIDRLTERRPSFTDAELEVLHPSGEDFDIERELLKLNEVDPVRDQIYAIQRGREKAYRDRIYQARHDFVDAMGGLWS